jgi:TolB-like protein/DNA-binding winged helix-turn-helix (wHTH) protein
LVELVVAGMLEARGLQVYGMEPTKTEQTKPTLLRIGDWQVNPATGQIVRGQETARLETRAMRLLLCLAGHAGEVVSIDELLSQVWPEVTVSQDSVYQAVTSLRRVLGDDPKQPSYIATVPRLGYRMVAQVGPWTDEAAPEAVNHVVEDELGGLVGAVLAEGAGAQTRPLRRMGIALSAVAALCVVAAVAFLVWGYHGKAAGREGKTLTGEQAASNVAAAQTEKSIAVLPFLDLTEGMKNEEFADGMTEELIDKLSKIPELRVAAPTSSFYYKGKQENVGDIAKALGVVYVLDGSVRKSGKRVRVAARLVRADSGYVVWTETYDRAFDDILMVQDDIAGEVTKALKSSTEFKSQ